MIPRYRKQWKAKQDKLAIDRVFKDLDLSQGVWDHSHAYKPKRDYTPQFYQLPAPYIPKKEDLRLALSILVFVVVGVMIIVGSVQ